MGTRTYQGIGYRDVAAIREPTALEIAKLKAKENAKVLIERKFKEPAALEDIYDMRADYQRKLAATESQLSGVVRTRLDGVKRAEDLIERSARQIGDLHGQFAKMEELCRDCRGLFGKYPHIKTLHHARGNLAVTAHLVDFFYTIPQKTKSLLELLAEQPIQIKHVYEESTRLEHWRDSFMAALKEYGEKAMSHASFKEGKGGADPIKYQMIVERVGPQLSVILELSIAIRRQIVENVAGRTDDQGNWLGGGGLELAMTNPGLLVRTLEVAELLRARKRRAYERAWMAAVKEGADREDAVAGLESGDQLYEEMVRALRRGLEQRITGQFAQMQMAAVDAGESRVLSTLGAANAMLVDLEAVETEVVPCFPPSYDIMAVFREVYEDFLVSLLSPLIGSPDRMAEHDVKDLLEAIKWLEYYNAKVKRNDFFAAAIVDLNVSYLGRIKGQIVKWVNNLKAQRLAPIQSSEGRYLTTFPDDMFNLINIQVSVAKTLPESFLGAVLVACLEVLQDIQEETMRSLNLNWKDIAEQEDGLEQLCAIVNDNVRLQEKSDEFVEGMAAGLQKKERDKLDDKIQTVSGAYVETAVLATSTIAGSMVLTLEQAEVIKQMFTPEWEDGTFEGMKTIVETFGDYFRDLQVWLPDFFFAKLVRFLLEKTNKFYVEHVLDITRKPFADPLQAAERINEDRQMVVVFFTDEEMPNVGTLGDVLAQAGLRDPGSIDHQVEMLRTITTLLEATDMDTLQSSAVQAAVKRIIKEFRSQGHEVVTHILNLQQKWTGEEKTARKEYVDRQYEASGGTGFGEEVSSNYELPGYKLPVPRGTNTDSKQKRGKP